MAMRWLARWATQQVAEHRPMLSSFSSSFSSAAPVLVPCGRGDKKTKRGKRFKGSYGNARPKREKKIERIKDRVEVPRDSFTGKVYGKRKTWARTEVGSMEQLAE